jgi:hypothetical protein
VSHKWIAASIVSVIILAALAYGGLRVIRLIGNPSLGIMRGSSSEDDSRGAGLYVGTYTPTRRLVPLTDLSVIHVPDAWVEHAWKPELTLFLQVHRVVVSGYYLYIPIHPDDSIGSNTTWPFKFGLKLDQQAQHISRYPGIGYEATLGFHVFLDTLPDTVRFIVEQKQHENDSWGNAVPVESIEFKRAF